MMTHHGETRILEGHPEFNTDFPAKTLEAERLCLGFLYIRTSNLEGQVGRSIENLLELFPTKVMLLESVTNGEKPWHNRHKQF